MEITAALSVFRRAIDLSQQINCLNRAGQAALTVFQEMGDRLVVDEKGNRISGRPFVEEVQSLEHDLIKHSLETAKGSITRAATYLGLSYQELNYMLNTRHKDLLTKRTPARRRSRKQ